MRNRQPVSDARREAAYKRDNWACLHCGTVDDLTIDHILPRCLGGTNDLWNLQTLCRNCHRAKDKDLMPRKNYRIHKPYVEPMTIGDVLAPEVFFRLLHA